MDELKDHVITNGFDILPITFEHTSRISTIEFKHKDPFDRMIIAQAMAEKLAIITKDDNFHLYSIKLVW